MSQTKVRPNINNWLKDNYGSRRGALLTYWCRILYLFGRYRINRQVNWDSVNRLVFVCKGNICRSAYAEAVAKSTGIDSISCGIDTVTGAPANALAIESGGKRGFDLSEHKTTPVQSLEFKKGDLLLVMEPWQAEYLQNELSVDGCSLLGLWGGPVTPYIHDPYGASACYFDSCFNYIENAVYRVAREINEVSS